LRKKKKGKCDRKKRLKEGRGERPDGLTFRKRKDGSGGDLFSHGRVGRKGSRVVWKGRLRTGKRAARSRREGVKIFENLSKIACGAVLEKKKRGGTSPARRGGRKW